MAGIMVTTYTRTLMDVAEEEAKVRPSHPTLPNKYNFRSFRRYCRLFWRRTKGYESRTKSGRSIRMPSTVSNEKTPLGHMKKERFLALWSDGFNGQGRTKTHFG